MVICISGATKVVMIELVSIFFITRGEGILSNSSMNLKYLPQWIPPICKSYLTNNHLYRKYCNLAIYLFNWYLLIPLVFLAATFIIIVWIFLVRTFRGKATNSTTFKSFERKLTFVFAYSFS